MLPSVCIRDREGKPVAYEVTFYYGAMGMLHVDPAHRGRGLAKYVTTRMARKHLERRPFAYILVEDGNDVSENLHRKLNFESKDTVTFIFYSPDNCVMKIVHS